MAKNSKVFKYVITILFLVALLLSSLVSVTLAYFSDKEENSIIINPAKMRTEIVTEQLSASDFIAGKIFNKSLNATFTGYFDIYFRTYAEVSVETYNEEKVKENRLDLVKTVYVDKCVEGTDGKHYFASEWLWGAADSPIYNMYNVPRSLNLSDSRINKTVDLNYVFKVSDNLTETMFENTNGNFDSSLKVVITYHIEYIQKAGYSNWVNFDSASLEANKIMGNTTQDSTPSQNSPSALKHTGTLITSDNYVSLGLDSKYIGKYAISLKENGINRNLFDISKLRRLVSYNTQESLRFSEVTNNSVSITYNKEYVQNRYDNEQKTVNGYTQTLMKLSELAPSLEVGKTYTLSFNKTLSGSEAWNLFYLEAPYAAVWSNGKSLTISQDMLDSTVVMYGPLIDLGEAPEDGEEYDYTNTIYNIKIEEGTTITQYTPYGKDYIILDEPLKSVTHYSDKTKIVKDYIDLENGVVARKTKSIILSSELDINWSTNSSQNNIEGTYFVLLNKNTLFGSYDATKFNNGGLMMMQFGISSHFENCRTVHNTSSVGFSTQSLSASPPYFAIRLVLDDMSTQGARDWCDDQKESGTPVEFVFAYYEAQFERIVYA
ncbi:MAG: hypothetical protein E7359_00745 [Clostridiales bacterium]|nr:hypothetical protein [Clostridiales bacterium]